MSERWARGQVLGLAPDAPSQKAAGSLAKPAKWPSSGCDENAVWGECQGSGRTAYKTIVDLTEPAFKCSCPSRKFPCKHGLALMLLWSDGDVTEGSRPGWAAEWLDQRQQRAEKTTERREAREKDPRTAELREQQVDDGVAEFARWLSDQVAHGLAAAERAPYALWDDAARRLVDAKAPALAGRVKGLAAIPRRGEGWPDRLLEEYGLLHLLVRAHQRRSDLSETLQATVRSKVGFTLTQDEVLAGERLRDHWYVAGLYDAQQEQLTTRRVWLRGQHTGRSAMVLSFAPAGRVLDTSLVVGSVLDAELAFYPGAQPLRAVVADRHGVPHLAPPRGTSVSGLLEEYAAALARDPWLDRWPAVLDGVRLGRGNVLVDAHGAAIPLLTPDPWRLLAVSGGGPITVAGEWTPAGLRPLSAWSAEEGVVVLS
ncbi:MAG: SWIM zinc finger family protein [Streptosporangiaceae bacterium]